MEMLPVWAKAVRLQWDAANRRSNPILLCSTFPEAKEKRDRGSDDKEEEVAVHGIAVVILDAVGEPLQ